MDNEQSHPLDELIGANVRQRRLLLEMSQDELGKSLTPPVSFQQIQKYEKGVNRIPSPTLWFIARQLKCSVTDFFDKAEVLLTGKDVVIDMPSREDLAVLVKYRKLPIDLKPYIADFIGAVANGLRSPEARNDRN